LTQEKIQSQVGMIEPWKKGSLRPIWCLLSRDGIKRHLEEGQLEVRSQKKLKLSSRRKADAENATFKPP